MGGVFGTAPGMWLWAFLCGACLLSGSAMAARRPQTTPWESQLPEGAAKKIVVAKCRFCHTLERVVTAHLPRDGWTDVVNQMIQLGSPVTKQEAPALIEYLARNFGPAEPVPSPRAVSSGKGPGAGSGSERPSGIQLVDPDRVPFAPLAGSGDSPKDAKRFVVSGDPEKPGLFSVLLKIPAGGEIPPGWLAAAAEMVCLRGTIAVGETGAGNGCPGRKLSPGDMLHVPAGAHRFCSRTGGGAVLLLYGNGPASEGRNR